jgi:hypothetical protein
LAATVITISRKIQRIIQQDRNSRLGGLCKKLDMGKGCVRFKSLEDLALDVVGRTVARVSVEEHMANYRAARARKVK